MFVQEKLVFADPLLPFGTIREAHPQIAHLQSTRANPRPKFAKELFFSHRNRILENLLYF